MSKRRRGFP